MLERCAALWIGERCCPARDVHRAFLRLVRPGASRRDGQRGFTYIGLLFIVMAFGAGLAGVSLVWHTAARRDKEAELLFVGKQYRQAIASYYASGQREFPARLEDLLLDPRFPGVKRHLRRLYPDPITGTTEWGLVKLGDRIIGIYSLAPGTPLREAPGDAGDPPLGGSSYGDWKFVVDPTTQSQAAVAPDPRARLQMPVTPPAPQASDYKSAIADDPCEGELEAAITRCGGGDPTQNPDFQACVMTALEGFQKCKGGG